MERLCKGCDSENEVVLYMHIYVYLETTYTKITQKMVITDVFGIICAINCAINLKNSYLESLSWIQGLGGGGDCVKHATITQISYWLLVYNSMDITRFYLTNWKSI